MHTHVDLREQGEVSSFGNELIRQVPEYPHVTEVARTDLIETYLDSDEREKYSRMRGIYFSAVFRGVEAVATFDCPPKEGKNYPLIPRLNAARGLATVFLEEECLRYDKLEKYYGEITGKKQKRGLYADGPLMHYYAHHRRMPMGYSSQDDVRRFDYELQKRRLSLGAEAVPLDRLTNALVIPELDKQVNFEREFMLGVMDRLGDKALVRLHRARQFGKLPSIFFGN